MSIVKYKKEGQCVINIIIADFARACAASTELTEKSVFAESVTDCVLAERRFMSGKSLLFQELAAQVRFSFRVARLGAFFARIQTYRVAEQEKK
jgi:hypothetical protein